MTKWKIALGVVGVAAVAVGTTLYQTFGAFLPWRENDEVARLATLTGVRSGQHIAEIGAGGGRFSLALAVGAGRCGCRCSCALDAPVAHDYDVVT